MANFEFSRIKQLLRKSEHDEGVKSFFGETAMSNVARDEYYGSLQFKPDGVDVVFKEAPWVLPASEVIDPKILYVSSFHLHGPGHEGFAGYSGLLPNGIVFGDSEIGIIDKMGSPKQTGGGKMSVLLGKLIPRWFLYSFENAELHFQLDPDGRLEMVTLSVPKLP
jgi:hypothetical protein